MMAAVLSSMFFSTSQRYQKGGEHSLPFSLSANKKIRKSKDLPALEA